MGKTYRWRESVVSLKSPQMHCRRLNRNTYSLKFHTGVKLHVTMTENCCAIFKHIKKQFECFCVCIQWHGYDLHKPTCDVFLTQTEYLTRKTVATPVSLKLGASLVLSIFILNLTSDIKWAQRLKINQNIPANQQPALSADTCHHNSLSHSGGWEGKGIGAGGGENY